MLVICWHPACAVSWHNISYCHSQSSSNACRVESTFFTALHVRLCHTDVWHRQISAGQESKIKIFGIFEHKRGKKRRKKKEEKVQFSLALALTLTLTLTVTLSPNHLATSYCWQVGALHHLMCTVLMHLPMSCLITSLRYRQMTDISMTSWSMVNKVDTVARTVGNRNPTHQRIVPIFLHR